jgi:CheY-like chemotaxis protein
MLSFMRSAVLIHWNQAEGREQVALIRQLGFKVELEFRSGPSILQKLRAQPPPAVLIGLDRLPMQGRDIAIAIRTARHTRQIPIVFVGGEPTRVARVKELLPDAIYASWHNIAGAVRQALSSAPVSPVVPKSNLAGYSGTPLPKKLGIKSHVSVALLNELENFVEYLGELPEGVEFTRAIGAKTGVVLWFVRSLQELSSQVDSVARRVIAADSCRLWIAWAKRTSPLASNVTENLVRASALGAGLVDYKVAAIDSDWSGLLFAPRRPAKAKKAPLRG